MIQSVPASGRKIARSPSVGHSRGRPGVARMKAADKDVKDAVERIGIAVPGSGDASTYR